MKKFDKLVQIHISATAYGGQRASVLGAVGTQGAVQLTPGLRLADVVAEPLKMVPDGNYLVNIEKPDGVKKLLNYQVRAGVAECVNASAQDSVGLKGKFSYVEDGVFKIHVSNARHNGTLFWKFGDDGIAQVKEVPDRGEKQFAVPVEGDTLIYPTQ